MSKPVGVFLSYAHEDDDIVTVFERAFEELGKHVGQNLEVYRDRTSIGAGMSISKKIQEDLRRSDYLVVFYTGTLRQSVSWTGVEVGFFQAIMDDDPKRGGTTERKIVSVYFDEMPPTLTDIKGISLRMETSDLSLPREEYVRSVSQPRQKAEDDPLAEFLRDVARLAESRHVSTDNDKARDDKHRKQRDAAIDGMIVPSIRTAMYDCLGSRVARRSIEQKLIEFQLDPAPLRERSGGIPPSAELKEHGSAFNLFKISGGESKISWSIFTEQLGSVAAEETPAITRAIERVFDTAISTAATVDNDQLIKSPADGKLYRVLVTRHFDYYNGKKIVHMYFIEKLRKDEFGAEETTIALAYLNVAARYRSIFLEAESELSEEAFKVQDDFAKLQDMVSRTIKEIILIEDDSRQMKLDSMKAKVILWGKKAALNPAKKAKNDWTTARSNLFAAAAKVLEAQPTTSESTEAIKNWMTVLKSFTETAKKLNSEVAQLALRRLAGFFKSK